MCETWTYHTFRSLCPYQATTNQLLSKAFVYDCVRHWLCFWHLLLSFIANCHGYVSLIPYSIFHVISTGHRNNGNFNNILNCICPGVILETFYTCVHILKSQIHISFLFIYRFRLNLFSSFIQILQHTKW